MKTLENNSVAGLSLGGGKKENFFLSLINYFEKDDQLFLNLCSFKEERPFSRDEVVSVWIERFDLKKLILDFPLTTPFCEQCELACPGVKDCPSPRVVEIRDSVEKLLTLDAELEKENPKRYEQTRELLERGEEITYSERYQEKGMLPKGLKKKLKKGLTPYWHRAVDYQLWLEYYEDLLSLFGHSYDSFGQASAMTLKRFSYLKKHFPDFLSVQETNVMITLVELYRAGIIKRQNILDLKSYQSQAIARMDIVRSIEKHFKIFIYEKDFESLAKYARAFDSFILSLAGLSLIDHSKTSLKLEDQFLVSKF